MSQLPVSPVVSQPPSTSASQSPSSQSPESGAGLEGAQGQNFGEVLTKQIKQIKKETSRAEASEGGEPAGKADAATVSPVDFSALIASSSAPVVPAQIEGVAGDASVEMMATELGSGEPSLRSDGEEIDSAVNPATLANLVADSPSQIVLSVAPIVAEQVDSVATEASVEMASGRASMKHSRADEIQLTAKAAGGGKDLPVAASSQKEFSEQLQAMSDIPPDRAGARLQSIDSSAIEQTAVPGGGVAVGVVRQQESSSALSVAPRVGSAEWGGAVGEKVLWMAGQSRQVAELHLNPPNLGPLEIRLTINSDQASAMFVSHHAAVREAIEAALPRLREMLADSGITLGNTTVGSESFNQQQQAFDRRGGGGGARADAGMESVLARISGSSRPVGLAHEGMVDIFA